MDENNVDNPLCESYNSIFIKTEDVIKQELIDNANLIKEEPIDSREECTEENYDTSEKYIRSVKNSNLARSNESKCSKVRKIKDSELQDLTYSKKEHIKLRRNNIFVRPKKASKKSRGRKENPASATPSLSPSDRDDSGSTSSQLSLAKKKRAKKAQFCLDVLEEQFMCDFLRENDILWDIKKTDYRRVDKKAKLWDYQAKVMGKTVEHLQGWFKSLRDTHTRLDKKSGDGAPELTEREQWVKVNFDFLKTVIRHHAKPISSVKATISAHNGDLEVACAEIVIDDDSTPSLAPSSAALRKGKRSQNDDQLLQSLQKRLHESEELLKYLAQPQPITATAAFANYVRDILVSLSKRKFRKARSYINAFLEELMDEESDEEEPPRVPTFPVSVRPTSAPATYIPTMSEMYQAPSHMWRHKAPAASVWGSQTADYVDQYMQQPQ